MAIFANEYFANEYYDGLKPLTFRIYHEKKEPVLSDTTKNNVCNE